MARHTCESLLARLPEKVSVEVLREDFPARYSCRVLAARGTFLCLEGMEVGERPYCLPLGSRVRLGFALREGWGEWEAEIIAWSASPEGSQMMVRYSPTGVIIQRRRHLRFGRRLPVVCLAPLKDAQARAGDSVLGTTGETRNLSRSGMCVHFPFPLPKGRKLAFRLLPGAVSPVRLKGEVIWQESLGEGPGECLAGIDVVPVSALQEKHYRALLARLSRTSPPRRGLG